MKKLCFGIFFAFAIAAIFCSFAFAETVDIVMDTWEIVPALNPEVDNLKVQTAAMLFGVTEEEAEYIPWDVKQRCEIWVTGWMIEKDEYSYDIGSIRLEEAQEGLVLINRVAQEQGEFFPRMSSDKIRVSFCIVMKDVGFSLEQMEAELRGLKIVASAFGTDYHAIDSMPPPRDGVDESINYRECNISVDMSRVAKRSSMQEPPIVASLTSLTLDEEAVPTENLYRIAKEYIEEGHISYWKLDGSIVNRVSPITFIAFAYVDDQVKVNDSIRLVELLDDFSLEIAMPYNAHDISMETAIQIIQKAHFTWMITAEPPMFYGNFMMGPFYPVELESTLLH